MACNKIFWPNPPIFLEINIHKMGVSNIAHNKICFKAILRTLRSLNQPMKGSEVIDQANISLVHKIS